jgi:hypothetical protein
VLGIVAIAGNRLLHTFDAVPRTDAVAVDVTASSAPSPDPEPLPAT